ncbi:MAG: aspartyl/glutamyl-tRNA amidotransferase subunit A [Treponema sp.]|jgi:aspartyl-tRNA(Asn)/glutamyl-tRNA(Gln) amidotransferase subunit A|nr:aspartyl/glutamyl-tRNA amidotransferase subunit A [Treponema sp.]
MPLTLPQDYESYVSQWEKKIGAFIEFEPSRAEPRDAGPPQGGANLNGLPFAVKDNIAVKGFSLSCGSKLLAQLRAPYTATAVEKLRAAGALPVGKTNLDEFGMGSSTDNSGIKRTNNPWDTDRVAGGSSGGSAAAVAAGLVPFALGSDTGGSVRQPAAFCGVLGLKPTYGAVSRFGLVAYASSLEGIGVLSDSVSRCRDVFAVIRGADPLDQTSRDAPAAAPPLFKPRKAATIGVLSPEAVARAIAAAAQEEGSAETGTALAVAAQAAELEPEVRRAFEAAKAGFAELGYRLVELEIPSLKYGVPAYYTIATAEASANLARFDGVRYGARPDWAENPDDLIDKTREAGFGPEVKLRILLGTFVLRSGFQDRYYLRAQRIRSAIRKDFEALLGDGEYRDSAAAPCDAILLPVFPTRAFGRGSLSLSPFAQKAADLYTCCANLAGLPALSFPASVEGGLPVGVQLIGRAFAEGTLLDIAGDWETRHPLPHPVGYRSFWS